MYKFWTDEEVKYLKENYETEYDEDISKKLNKTISSINHKAHYLGLKKKVFKIKKMIAGKKFGRLTAIKPLGKVKGYNHWECICDCGKIVSRRTDCLNQERTKSCGCYNKEITTINNHKRKLPNNGAAKNSLYNKYKWDAKDRNLNFSLTFEQFISLVERNCFYCGIEPQQINMKKFNYKYNGIDRINNSIGYRIENCQTLCKNCNFSKRDNSEEEFNEWFLRVAKYKFNLVNKI